MSGNQRKHEAEADLAFDVESDEDDDDNAWGEEDNDWGENTQQKRAANFADLKNFDYANTDLNKLDDEELALHKKNMDGNFLKNQLRPGDKGF
mmetsp:Transcript_8225/g.10770  ORF Transcript_8225/g.10770 Transcript_8225/m.10770 type:complete len:93 (+) Transcript_8225:827-1105(+)